jgi:hypothetical protein
MPYAAGLRHLLFRVARVRMPFIIPCLYGLVQTYLQHSPTEYILKASFVRSGTPTAHDVSLIASNDLSTGIRLFPSNEYGKSKRRIHVDKSLGAINRVPTVLRTFSSQKERAGRIRRLRGDT